jgi:hypothetical protein
MNLVAESENTYQKAVELAERLFGKCDIKVASALTQLGTFYRAHRRFEEASECESRIREILEGWYGGRGISVSAMHRI